LLLIDVWKLKFNTLGSPARFLKGAVMEDGKGGNRPEEVRQVVVLKVDAAEMVQALTDLEQRIVKVSQAERAALTAAQRAEIAGALCRLAASGEQPLHLKAVREALVDEIQALNALGRSS